MVHPVLLDEVTGAIGVGLECPGQRRRMEDHAVGLVSGSAKGRARSWATGYIPSVRLLVLAVLALVAGCGAEETTAPKAATPTPSPTVKPVTGAERYKAQLQNAIDNATQDRRRYCYPMDSWPEPALAGQYCEYRDGPRGSYLLFDSRVVMRQQFRKLARRGRPGRSGPCPSRTTWQRVATPDQTEGWMAIRRVGSQMWLVWTYESERVVAVVRTRVATREKLCAVWRESS
jgi:hypothetical protein